MWRDPVVTITVTVLLGPCWNWPWLRDFEPHIAIINVLPYAEVVRGFTYVQRMNAELFAVLAVVGLSLAAVGIFSVMSLAASFVLTRLVQEMLFGVAPTDPLTLVLGTAVMVLAALAACYLPARRAARVDPMEALRASGG